MKGTTGPSGFPTETGTQGDYADIKSKDVAIVEEELPDSMMRAIKIIERLLTQSEYHEAHVLYKDYPSADVKKASREDEDKANEKDQGRKMPGFGAQEEKEEDKEEEKEEIKYEEGDEVLLKHLFQFRCDLTDGRQVSCMDINTINKDLIAVSYGEFDIICTQTKNLKKGLLAFWTLKNPSFPEKILEWDYSITSCQFSKKNPHLIAIGDSQGNVALFNIRSEDLTPIASTKDLDNKHTDIVWEVQWVDRERTEALVSVAGDGRVIEWSMKRGLDMIELTTLKRETNPNQKDVFASANAYEKDKKGGVTFITTGGMTIDFPSAERGQTYYAATEDCSVHKCSISYPDQYLASYYGHSGPVYRLRCNPFWDPNHNAIYLTCSYDWTIRVWNALDTTKEVLICQQVSGDYPLKAQVNDIAWSPITSSCFASVADDGRVEIWDLKINPLAPVVTHFDKTKDGEIDNK